MIFSILLVATFHPLMVMVSLNSSNVLPTSTIPITISPLLIYFAMIFSLFIPSPNFMESVPEISVIVSFPSPMLNI